MVSTIALKAQERILAVGIYPFTINYKRINGHRFFPDLKRGHLGGQIIHVITASAANTV
jgi:hypothetical protein